ncbi:hypothetical protein CPC08DRAFT_824663 [Agrocybe pediades]|nr:hypothetical protein CPC08DRAFT_824663 [Agrocybe pediades]
MPFAAAHELEDSDTHSRFPPNAFHLLKSLPTRPFPGVKPSSTGADRTGLGGTIHTLQLARLFSRVPISTICDITIDNHDISNPQRQRPVKTFSALTGAKVELVVNLANVMYAIAAAARATKIVTKASSATVRSRKRAKAQVQQARRETNVSPFPRYSSSSSDDESYVGSSLTSTTPSHATIPMAFFDFLLLSNTHTNGQENTP